MNQSERTAALHNAALKAVFCNSMMLEVCDALTSTTLYKHDRKQRINALTKDLESFLAGFYKGISEEEEKQYYAMVRSMERLATLLATMPPHQMDQAHALLKSFQQGEVYVASTEKQESNLINQKRIKPLTP
ncbi:hypothetical protein GGR92_000020 [Spirosoma lacussanchae]|uniref:hypothetical protein n=1 Tax=Spirosoma lacussanchae TaxID=1884249 RepID=UPI001108D63F|nr:hypothetical protein [Spirosoma lacussanchae]